MCLCLCLYIYIYIYICNSYCSSLSLYLITSLPLFIYISWNIYSINLSIYLSIYLSHFIRCLSLSINLYS